MLDRVLAGESLSADGAAEIFAAVLDGAWEPVQVAALLAGLRAKGESPEELAGAARAMLAAAAPFPRPAGLLADTCGTGGDGQHTVNLSTAAALVVASAGVPVVKHGNRSVSSRSGSADVLEACGVRIDLEAAAAAACLAETGFCFLFAPVLHPGLAPVMPVRRALGVRTLFNLLGPVVNPARPTHQVIGVFDARWCRPLAETLALLGTRRALVVHGAGLDELAVHGETAAVWLEDGAATALTLTPEQAGIPRHPLDALRGGAPEQNAAWLREILSGRGTDAHRDAVALNAGAALWVSGQADSLRGGTEQALEILATGRAARLLEAVATASQRIARNAPAGGADGQPGGAQ